jgi:hypothetical protein
MELYTKFIAYFLKRRDYVGHVCKHDTFGWWSSLPAT